MNNDIYDLVKIREIKELFDNAENLAKEVELFQSGVSTPAINQLRYAGQHLLKALVTDSKSDFDSEVLKAKGHCQRSMYEASESGIAYAQEAIQDFQRDYSDLVIPEVLPEYTDMMFRADKASEVLAQGRIGRNSAEDQVDRYMETFRELRGIVGKLQVSRSSLNAKRLALGKEYRRYVLTTTLTVCITILSIFGLLK